MRLSVIIPTYREENAIGPLIHHLFNCDDRDRIEVIVSDGGSPDNTLCRAEAAGARAFISPKKGRAAQQNFGASQASGDVLYFLHADCFPPRTFVADIFSAIEKGYDFGNFRQMIKSKNPWVKLNTWGSRLNGKLASGGDQSLFITRELFLKLGGYREDYIFMEDYDFYDRACVVGTTVKIPRDLEIIDRKYTHNSFLRVNLSNFMIFIFYRLGVHPNRLFPLYKGLIKGPRYKDLD